jgi:hypothetical protein
VLNSKRLVLAHFWLAFVVFGLALLLGEWQMFVRSPLNPWISNSELYYRSVTAHGSPLPSLTHLGHWPCPSKCSQCRLRALSK